MKETRLKRIDPWRAALALALGLFTAAAQAQAWPGKPLHWIVPFPAGGPTDPFSRPVAQRLSEELGVPMLIDNRGGIGVDAVAKAAPDGRTRP